MKKIFTLLIVILISFLIFSFTSVRVLDKNPKKDSLVTVTGLVQINVPYSGGDSPPPELEYGYFYNSRNTELHFVLKDDITKTSFAKTTTDTLGKFSIQLPPGDYCIFQSQKMMDLDSLAGQFNPRDMYPVEMGEDPCIKQWYNTPDLCINAAKDTFVNIVLPSRNPCSQQREIDHP